MFTFAAVQSQVDEHECLASKLALYCRKIVQFSSQLTYTQPYATKTNQGKRNLANANNRCPRLTAWPTVVRGIAALCALHLTVVCALQYPYDVQLFHYQHPTSDTNDQDRQKIESYLADRLRLLKLLGAPFVKLSMSGPFGYTICVWCDYMGLFQPLLLACLSHSPLQFSLITTFATPRQDKLKMDRRLRSLIGELIHSSEQFARNINIATRGLNQSAYRTQEQHRQLRQHIWKLYKSGSLNPLNRTLKSVERQAELFTRLYAILFISFYLPALVAAFFVPNSGIVPGASLDLQSWTDYLAMAEVAFGTCLGSFSLSYFITIMSITILDRIQLMNKVIGLIRRCILVNDWIYHQPMKDSHKSELINSNLLVAFMHYRLLALSMKSAQKTFTFFLLFSFQFLLLGPFTSKFHVGYFHENIISLFLFLCILYVLIGDCFLLPICQINSCSSHLYESLFSLLAHTIEFDLANRDRGRHHDDHQHRPGEIYNTHIVGLLRKELKEHENQIDLFAAKLLGFRFTHPNLIKLHFLSGLLLGSILTGDGRTGAKLSWIF